MFRPLAVLALLASPCVALADTTVRGDDWFDRCSVRLNALPNALTGTERRLEVIVERAKTSTGPSVQLTLAGKEDWIGVAVWVNREPRSTANGWSAEKFLRNALGSWQTSVLRNTVTHWAKVTVMGHERRVLEQVLALAEKAADDCLAMGWP
jgi:hypothetical protein